MTESHTRIAPRTFPFVLGLIALLGAPLAARAASCARLAEELQKVRARLADLRESKKALEAEFDTSVEKDFSAQAEGLMDGPHRNHAMKVSFARNKVMRAIEAKEKEAEALRGDYCRRCVKVSAPPPASGSSPSADCAP